MLKSKIRKKILNIRKKNYNQNNKFFNLKLFKEINKINLKKKIIGGYYPVNFEVNILELLNKLEKKDLKLSLPVVKKIKK